MGAALWLLDHNTNARADWGPQMGWGWLSVTAMHPWPRGQWSVEMSRPERGQVSEEEKEYQLLFPSGSSVRLSDEEEYFGCSPYNSGLLHAIDSKKRCSWKPSFLHAESRCAFPQIWIN